MTFVGLGLFLLVSCFGLLNSELNSVNSVIRRLFMVICGRGVGSEYSFGGCQ